MAPVDSVKKGFQFFATLRIKLLHPVDSSSQMGLKVDRWISILRNGIKADAIVKYCLELIEFWSWDVGTTIEHGSGG